MVGILVNLLLILVIAVVVYAILEVAARRVPIEPDVKRIIYLILFLILVIWVVNVVSGGVLWRGGVVVV